MAVATDLLRTLVRKAELCQPLAGKKVRCFACGHCCQIAAGHAGVCRVRFNEDGVLQAPWGYVSGAHCDPVEKKPFFHVRPGARAYSFGMLGCDLHCGYCQNWVTSQALRDPRSTAPPQPTTPARMVREALDSGAEILVSTYNEPLITAEWAVAVFREARAAGLMTGLVSNGNGTPQVLDYLRPWLDLYKVDLKGFNDFHYRQLGGRLQPVLDTIRRIHAMGLWLEVVTLVVPGFNDSPAELESLAAFLANVSPDIPWHVTAFHRDYKMTGLADTGVQQLTAAAEIGRRAGLRYVYAGNMPGQVGHLEDTVCPACGKTVVRRAGYHVIERLVTQQGRCGGCAAPIPGRWN